MNSRVFMGGLGLRIALASGVAAVCYVCTAGPAEKPSADKPAKSEAKAAPTAAANAYEVAVTKSVFTVPTSVKEGRNPFFPGAKVSVEVPKDKEQSLEASAFVLNGITGPPLRSAMINGRTFLKGEEGEVRLQNGAKIMIKCSDIRDESAVIVVGGIQRELRLRFGI